ncbi:MAG TPA: hypothetical protein VKU82_02295 [Planctomycetaceae bacterium]|nr:hypothetical protein [Planctomycetaceae bacterium]
MKVQDTAAMTDEIRRLAARQLADLDAKTPNRMFSRQTELSVAQAYELQTEVARLRETRGEKIIGYKVGCTSRAIQQQLGIGEPIFGRLFDTSCYASGTKLSCRSFANLAVEGEIAIRLNGAASDASLGNEEYLKTIAEVFPVIELHHYVLQSPNPCCQELIASNGMHAGFVLADDEGRPMPDGKPDLTIWIKDDSGDMIAKSSLLSRPIESLRWLAARLAGFGLALSPGQVVLTGSPMRLFPVGPGSEVVVKTKPAGTSRAEFVP